MGNLKKKKKKYQMGGRTTVPNPWYTRGGDVDPRRAPAPEVGTLLSKLSSLPSAQQPDYTPTTGVLSAEELAAREKADAAKAALLRSTVPKRKGGVRKKKKGS